MDLQAKRAEIEKRREERKKALDAQREEQAVQDLEALDALEVEHGDGAVSALELDHFVPGHPTFIIVRAPSGAQYKRFADQVGKAVEAKNPAKRREAQELLGQSCWVYPTSEDARKKMLEDFPGLLLSIAIKATQLVEARQAEEGKG